ncbi:MAG: menaquinol oxidoreductase, partial [Lentisphaerae bacterium]|nr:menaquinol oxidoreductase [Lentisphaerota bacterium]
MNILIPLVVVAGLFLVGLLGASASWLGWVFGVIVPYAAIVLFVVGLIRRVMGWANSAVPFRIPTTCGQ